MNILKQIFILLGQIDRVKAEPESPEKVKFMKSLITDFERLSAAFYDDNENIIIDYLRSIK